MTRPRCRRTAARELLRSRLGSPLLRDLLLVPTCYYGSALEDDIEVSQFAIMWRSLFREGFARPFEGVRRVIRLLTDRCREHGVERRMKCGVRRIEVRQGRAAALVLDDGSEVTADAVYSSAGAVETMRLRSDMAADAGAAEAGRLGYAETIATYAPAAFAGFGWKDTIVFFCDAERFSYRSPAGLVDPASGVICIPNNYDYGPERSLDEGWLASPPSPPTTPGAPCPRTNTGPPRRSGSAGSTGPRGGTCLPSPTPPTTPPSCPRTCSPRAPCASSPGTRAGPSTDPP